MEKNIYQKIIEVRKAIPYVKKDAKGYGFEYLKESTILGIIKEEMDNLGLILTQELYELNPITLTRTAKDGSYKEVTGVRASLVYKWINADNPSETFSLHQMLQDFNADIQGCGGILTYGMRYFLLKFFNIATDKEDPDAFDRKMDNFKSDDNNGLISAEQYDRLMSYDLPHLQASKAAMFKTYRINDYSQLQAQFYDVVLERLEAAYQRAKKEEICSQPS